MTDNELFELCKEVYKRTGWKDTHDRLSIDSLGIHQIRNEGNEVLLGSKQTPLYTSDYLLEKLPAYIQSKVYPKKRASLEMEKDGVDGGTPTYFFWYIVHGKDQSDLGVHSDTPLKALLKLTIALSEAGELK